MQFLANYDCSFINNSLAGKRRLYQRPSQANRGLVGVKGRFASALDTGCAPRLWGEGR